MSRVCAEQGDSIVSIAFATGFHPDTLWDHAENQSLHTEDRSPAILHPGDEVFVPELRLTDESCATERLHRFRRKGVPSEFKIRFLSGGEPRKQLQFTTTIDDVHGPEGSLDDEGFARFAIPPNARLIRMTLAAPSGPEDYEFAVGHLNPVSRISGLKHRLNSLGYCCGDEDEEENEQLADALRAFQAANGLSASGQPDEATRDKVKQLYEAQTQG